MQSTRSDARWRDAIVLTIALWSFVLLMFLPVLIVDRHPGQGWFSILLDAATIPVSMAIGLLVFAVFRATTDWPSHLRLLALGGAVLTAAVGQTAYDVLYKAWVAQNLNAAWATLPMTGIYEKIFRYLLVFAVNLALFQLSYVRQRATRGARQLTDARSAAQQAQLQALRYQLNPHFLFNTLNSISSLIVTRRNEDAEQMTSKLSSFLRSSLTCDPAALVPFEEELALIEEYLDIEAVRFGERLNVAIDCETDAGAALIPSFLVQPLVENAIKHGVAPSREQVTITLRATLDEGLLCITVENCLPAEEPEAVIGAGVGLANVRQRLQAVFGDAASLDTHADGRSFTATICIPNARSRT